MRLRAAPEADPLAGVRDDVDEQVLPIFLEEASELFPQAGEALRACAAAGRRRQRAACAGRCTR